MPMTNVAHALSVPRRDFLDARRDTAGCQPNVTSFSYPWDWILVGQGHALPDGFLRLLG
jgi:hypothetical protein